MYPRDVFVEVVPLLQFLSVELVLFPLTPPFGGYPLHLQMAMVDGGRQVLFLHLQFQLVLV